MMFKLTKSSDWGYKSKIEFKTLNEVIEYVDKIGHPIIIHPKDEEGYEIEIYDYWRE